MERKTVFAVVLLTVFAAHAHGQQSQAQLLNGNWANDHLFYSFHNEIFIVGSNWLGIIGIGEYSINGNMLSTMLSEPDTPVNSRVFRVSGNTLTLGAQTFTRQPGNLVLEFRQQQQRQQAQPQQPRPQQQLPQPRPVACASCSGVGTRPCGVCNGSGRTWNNSQSRWENCRGMGCRGGRRQCGSCHGTGTGRGW